MIEEKKTVKLLHNLILEGRKNLTVSGVSDVDSFDYQAIVAYTDLGELTIKGKNLHISKLSIDSGDLKVSGEIISLSYSDNHQSSGGFLSKLFR